MTWLHRSLPLFVFFPALVAGPATAEAARVVYINTEPVTVTGGMNDPANDMVSVNGFMDTDFDGWAGASADQTRELLALLQDVSVEFDIEFTLERPAMGPYDMVVFGSADDHAGSFGGNCSPAVGLSDCSDANGVSIAFNYWGCLDVEDQLDTERVAFSTLGALGFGWGLESLAGNGQIMAQWSNNAVQWGTACTNLAGAAGCMHAECGADQQNSSADLLATLGARVDDGPPVLTVVSPADGSDVEDPFDVSVEIEDAFGGLEATLEVVDSGLPAVSDTSFPYGWAGLTLGAGPAILRVTAIDADGNSVSTDVSVCVGGGCPDDPDTGETGDEETSGGETSGGTTVGADEGGEAGCSCSADDEGQGVGFLAAALLGLLGLTRRRDLLR